MSALAKERDEVVSPSGVAFRTLLNFLDRLHEGGLPSRIDRSYWGPFLAGTNGGQLMIALRFLGLIEVPSGKPTEAIERVVRAEGNERKRALALLLRKAYEPVFGSEDVSRATLGHLQEAFTKHYHLQGDTRRKALAFFIHACQYCDIPLASFVTTRLKPRRSPHLPGSGASKPAAKRSRQVPGAAAPHTAAPRQTDATPTPSVALNQVGMQRTIALRGGGTVSVTIDAGWFNVDGHDRLFIHQLVDLLREYEQAQAIDDDFEVAEEEGPGEE